MEPWRLESSGVGRFDALAPTYDAWYDPPLGRPLGGPASGGGVGVDISATMLGIARGKACDAGLALALIRADACALPFRAGAVELVTIILGLEFVGEPRRVLEGGHRVLVPGGSLVIAILNRAGLWTVWRRLKRPVVPPVS